MQSSNLEKYLDYYKIVKSLIYAFLYASLFIIQDSHAGIFQEIAGAIVAYGLSFAYKYWTIGALIMLAFRYLISKDKYYMHIAIALIVSYYPVKFLIGKIFG